MTTPKRDGLHGLRSLRHELRERLKTNPDYLVLIEVEKAIQKIEEAVGKPKKPRTRGKSTTRISQIAAAQKVLEAKGEPLPVGELLIGIREAGAHVGGAKPTINLASVLSKHDRFRSVIWQGKSAWWLADRDYPDEHKVPEINEMDLDLSGDDEMDAAETASDDYSAASEYKRYAGGQNG